MSIGVRMIPRVKLWPPDGAELCEHELERGSSYVVVLECECGVAVDYPGHPDEADVITCAGCGLVWTVETDAERVVRRIVG